jgi:hypothetical protein
VPLTFCTVVPVSVIAEFVNPSPPMRPIVRLPPLRVDPLAVKRTPARRSAISTPVPGAVTVLLSRTRFPLPGIPLMPEPIMNRNARPEPCCVTVLLASVTGSEPSGQNTGALAAAVAGIENVTPLKLARWPVNTLPPQPLFSVDSVGEPMVPPLTVTGPPRLVMKRAPGRKSVPM